MLNKLKERGLKCNIESYFSGQTEIERLGFCVTRNGVKPINKKIEAIINMAPLTSRKEVRKFIGVINYYRNMRPRMSHTLATLTKLTYINRKFKWTNSNKIPSVKIIGSLKFIPMLARYN